MRILIVYESMFGNTHQIAEAIATGFAASDEVSVVPVDRATTAAVERADLLVVGGPTHIHSLSSQRSRDAAAAQADKPDSELTLDPDAEGAGLREWFDALSTRGGRAAAFDTRIDAPAVFTGRASKGIAKRLRRHKFELVADPKSFLVTKETHLEPGQADEARAWGAVLASAASVTRSGLRTQ